MTLLLMAAGNGSRYGKLKQFVALGPKAEFLMEFSIFDAIKYGFTHIVAVTKKDKVNFLQEYLVKRLPTGIKLDVLAQEISDVPKGTSYTTERIKPWGTAHAVWTARNVINGAFAVLNADDFYGSLAFKNAAKIMQASTKYKFGLISYTLKDTLSTNGSVSRGVCNIKNGVLTNVAEHLKLEKQGKKIVDTNTGIEFTGNEEVSMNFWVCDASIFTTIEEDFKLFLQDEEKIKSSEVFLPSVLQKMINKQNVEITVLNSESNWFGITYAEDRDIAVFKLAEMTNTGEYPLNLWNL
ncbi:nucleotidyltransferase family protein [Cellulophaga omnivescoria]|uniref:nucleotidyltransferase family protein n=1 Tax=Cellulophaga omnivescoria TaxID=1888890 RepID=UPI000987750F|nr:sugar phosphate nucleotidyltransferase [Cellulophaga omnivescoria]